MALTVKDGKFIEGEGDEYSKKKTAPMELSRGMNLLNVAIKGAMAGRDASEGMAGQVPGYPDLAPGTQGHRQAEQVYSGIKDATNADVSSRFKPGEYEEVWFEPPQGDPKLRQRFVIGLTQSGKPFHFIAEHGKDYPALRDAKLIGKHNVNRGDPGYDLVSSWDALKGDNTPYYRGYDREQNSGQQYNPQ